MQVKTESFDGGLTIQDWLDAGYKRYDQTTHNLSDFLLQKRFDDEVGKKYFINVWVYEHFNKEYYRVNPHMSEVSFSPEVQFRRDEENKPTVDVSLICYENTTIAEIEQEFEKLWEFLGKPYYEKFSEC